jgi:crotonobetaine/carnitine-CoA ligase
VTSPTVPSLLRRAAERFGEAPAIITREGTESFTELHRAAAAAAAAYRERGVSPGDRVLLMVRNSAPAVHAWLGAIYAGAIPAAVNPELTGPEREYVVNDLEPKVTLGDADLKMLATSGAHAPPPETDASSVAAIVYTSGTTSRPKGVMVRHAAYTQAGLAFPAWIGLGRQERLWACLPLFHINAQAYSLMSALAHGHSLALTDRFHASSFWQDARELQVTSVNVVGAMMAILARQPASTWCASSLRTIYAAPAPAPAERQNLETRFRVRITSGYGLSENPFGCVESPTSREKAGSVGRPRQPVSGAFINELRILRAGGIEVGIGEEGELCFRNPVMTPGYWNAPEITRATLVDGWLHTGDLGHQDADRDVFLTGRSKDMIRRRGENIAPAEVEDALISHPAVSAVAVLGLPSDLTEEEVVAVVVLADGQHADEAELQAWAAKSLAPYKIPSRIVFRSTMPMTPTLRVAKELLRRELMGVER